MPDELASPRAGSSDFFRELDIQILVHELKSPLSLIEAATRTLLAHPSRLGSLTERQEKSLKRILRGAVRGRRLVHQLLEIGAADSSQFNLSSFYPAEAVLKTVLESLESIGSELADRLNEESDSDEKIAVLAQGGISIRIAPGIRNKQIFQDQSKFDLIVSNLLQNALQFRNKLIEIELNEKGGDVILVVRDDGPGISPEHHAAIFERYKQLPASDGLEREGHGLGLAGALILARRLGGDISLDSVPDQGAMFRLRIPCEQAQGQTN